MSWATAKQPMSRLSERSKSVADWLVRSGQVGGIEDEILARRSAGIEKYGIELTSHNGRRPLIDAYQEVLDLIVYLAQSDDDLYLVGAGTTEKPGGCRWHRMSWRR
jgi:hypothetical protein